MRARLACWCLLALLYAFCGRDQGADLFRAAQREERRENYPGAAALYGRIVHEYPKSAAAARAQARLADLHDVTPPIDPPGGSGTSRAAIRPPRRD